MSTSTAPPKPIAVAIDIMDEDHSLRLAMRRLASDAELRATLGAAGRVYWEREHSPARMIDDYREILAAAASAPVPAPSLPRHLVNDGDALLNEVLAGVGVANPFKAAEGPRKETHSLG